VGPKLPNAGRRRRSATVRCARVSLVATGLSAVVACHPDAPVASVRRPASLQRVSGSGQSAQPGTELARPLIARVVDGDGHPVAGADVRWRAMAGQVTPPTSTSDGNGDARAAWRVGSTPGVQRVMAEVDGADAIEFVAFVDPAALPERLPLRAIPLATYDGSGQAVHPDFLAAPFGGLDDRSRLAITPYPWGNAVMENPSLFAGSEPDGWSVPAGVTNPIVRPDGGYLSDPDLVWDPDARELRLYYRHVAEENRILLVTSRDGVTFSGARLVVRAPSHQIVSPTVVRRSATEWMMWSVNSGPVGCSASSTTVELRRSTDGVQWSAPTTVSLSQPGVFAWHLEVQWIDALGEYWAVFNGKVRGSCTTQALYIATSTDGMTWRTFPSPVLRSGVIPELDDIVYRATFAYEPERDLVALWHSGAQYRNGGYEWRAAYERRRRSDLFETVARAEPAFIARRPRAELDNATAP